MINVNEYDACYTLEECLNEKDYLKLKKLSGIYIIRNSKDNKEYIGSTKDFMQRITEHLYYLQKNKHHSKKLQNAVNKYSLKSFTIYIYKINENRNTLYDMETELIKERDSFVNGYNQAIDSRSFIKAEHTGTLSKEDILFIRSNVKNYTQAEFAEMYNVTEKHISKIVHLNEWSDSEYIPKGYRPDYKSKYSDEEILEMRKLGATLSYEELAKKFNTTKSFVCQILGLRRYNRPHLIPEGYIIPNKKTMFTIEDVLFIRNNIYKYSNKQFAEMFNCPTQTIVNIIGLTRWTNPESIPKGYIKPDRKERNKILKKDEEGKLLVKEILHNTHDNTGLIDEISI